MFVLVEIYRWPLASIGRTYLGHNRFLPFHLSVAVRPFLNTLVAGGGATDGWQGLGGVCVGCTGLCRVLITVLVQLLAAELAARRVTVALLLCLLAWGVWAFTPLPSQELLLSALGTTCTHD